MPGDKSRISETHAQRKTAPLARRRIPRHNAHVAVRKWNSRSASPIDGCNTDEQWENPCLRDLFPRCKPLPQLRLVSPATRVSALAALRAMGKRQ